MHLFGVVFTDGELHLKDTEADTVYERKLLISRVVLQYVCARELIIVLKKKL